MIALIVRTTLLPLALSLAAASAVESQAGSAGCPPATQDLASLRALRANDLDVPSDADRNQLAVALVLCLTHPDPSVRDGIAFEALQKWMRAKTLAPETVVAIRDRLVQMLTGPEGDGFARPFAALVLADVARTDRIEPWMTAAERSALVATAAAYVQGVRDYRGFDEREGWRHGVAHGADLLMQLAYNPALTRSDLDLILAAVASQVAPDGHAYRYGEAERLAAPVIAVARRGVHTQAEWDAWFAAVAAPAPLAAWGDAYSSQAGLAKRHNTMAFLSFLYVNAKIGDAPHYAPLVPGIEAGLRALP